MYRGTVYKSGNALARAFGVKGASISKARRRGTWRGHRIVDVSPDEYVERTDPMTPAQRAEHEAIEQLLGQCSSYHGRLETAGGMNSRLLFGRGR